MDPSNYKTNVHASLLVLIVFILFAVIPAVENFGYKWQGRLIGLWAMYVFFPFWILWASFCLKGKFKQIRSGKVIMFSMGLFWICFYAFPIIKNSVYLISRPPSVLEGIVRNVSSERFHLEANGITSKDGLEVYSFNYANKLFQDGDHVRIKFLPNTRYILEVRKR